ncbi:hypothetical protein HII31_09678 [Pseudocercospora fuligena]|uniref:Uncharacterized protein n=1 Tax=Pseudocercospora fuligena TaxID=685502 RepID=A0A8H6RDC8_9PEZI|nr:hypothetical protein HII31_09678 [Pseudocercospora fuligena]
MIHDHCLAPTGVRKAARYNSGACGVSSRVVVFERGNYTHALVLAMIPSMEISAAQPRYTVVTSTPSRVNCWALSLLSQVKGSAVSAATGRLYPLCLGVRCGSRFSIRHRLHSNNMRE